jgi:RimJ/RimL family protein N-acetyltransferase
MVIYQCHKIISLTLRSDGSSMDCPSNSATARQMLDWLISCRWDVSALARALPMLHGRVAGSDGNSQRTWCIALNQLVDSGVLDGTNNLRFRVAILAAELHLWSIALALFSALLDCTSLSPRRAVLLVNLGAAAMQNADHHRAQDYLRLAARSLGTERHAADDSAAHLQATMDEIRRRSSVVQSWIVHCQALMGAQSHCLASESTWVARSGGIALTMTPLGSHHAAALCRLQRDVRVADSVGVAALTSISSAQAWIAAIAKDDIVFAIVHPALGLIGVAALLAAIAPHDIVAPDSARFYYWIGSDYQGSGFATQALALLRQVALRGGVRHLFSTIAADNLPSRRVLTKLGGRKLPFPRNRCLPGYDFFHYGDDVGVSLLRDRLSDLLLRATAVEQRSAPDRSLNGG